MNSPRSKLFSYGYLFDYKCSKDEIKSFFQLPQSNCTIFPFSFSWGQSLIENVKIIEYDKSKI